MDNILEDIIMKLESREKMTREMLEECQKVYEFMDQSIGRKRVVTDKDIGALEYQSGEVDKYTFKLLAYQDALNIAREEINKKEKSRSNDSNQKQYYLFRY
jgi:hypothetical protein